MIEKKLLPSVSDKNDNKHRGLNDIVRSLSQTQAGSHQIVVYPELGILREIYSHYVQDQLENNEIVLMLTYYETVESVKAILSEFRTKEGEKISVAQHLDNGSLLILDGHEAFFEGKKHLKDKDGQDVEPSFSNHDNIVSLMRIMQNQVKKLNKDGIAIFLDMGCFFQNGGIDYILKYEGSIPQIFRDSGIKQLCIYHQKDFESRFSKSEKASLLDSHGRSVLMLDA